MGSLALTGNDTIIIGDRVLANLADGDTGSVEFPNKLVEAKVGKNGNVVYALNAQGLLAEATIRTLRGSADDKYLNSQMNDYLNDPANYSVMDGEFIKRIGDGAGNVANETYLFAGGIITNLPTVKENVAGETEQAVTVWKITFGNTKRSIA